MFWAWHFDAMLPCIFFEKGTPTQNTHLQTKGGQEKDVMIASSIVCVYVCLYMLRSRRGFNSSSNLYFASKKRDMIVGKEWRMEKWYAC